MRTSHTWSVVDDTDDNNVDTDTDDDETPAPYSANLSSASLLVAPPPDPVPAFPPDPERTPRHTHARDYRSPSHLRNTHTVLKSVSRGLKRVSVRVVNLAATGTPEPLRLPDEQPPEHKHADDADDPPSTPLRGRTLGLLGPSNPLRLTLFHILVHPWTEPAVLALIVLDAVVLTLQASRALYVTPSIKGYFHTWEDYLLFVLFVLFTLEALARIAVSGFLFDPELSLSTLFATSPPPHDASSVHRILNRIKRPFVLASSSSSGSGPHHTRSDTTHSRTAIFEKSPPVPSTHILSLPFQLNVADITHKLSRNIPYLRHSWCRIDLVAVVGFWIAFALAVRGRTEPDASAMRVFRAVSVLRTARLLAVTSGTTTIMRSLKTARPLLANVAYFVVFAMLLFSIIGVQSFNGSFSRQCYLAPVLGESQMQIQNQFCGGYIDPVTLQTTPWLTSNGSQGAGYYKGFICPLGQVCQEGPNPNNGIESFDSIFHALLQVVIVASANGWSPIMYAMIDAEYFVSCFFFIVCILVLNFWLINLLVAVITNTFSAIRSETRKSAFGAAPLGPLVDEQDESWTVVDGRHGPQSNFLKRFYRYGRWCWIALALASLVVQATRTVNMSTTHQAILLDTEFAITIAFDVEMGIRFLAELPAWRTFFLHAGNWLDLGLALGSSVIQIPVVRDSSVYPWLTIFQLGRFYRVILEVPRMKPLMLTVFGNMYGLANMTLFLLLVNFLAALVAVQLLRGDMPSWETMNFSQIFNAFLAVYQIFSSENWTTVLYDATEAELSLGLAVIAAIFISCWLLFANFIVLQMFIAVINENFSVAEETKRARQVSNYWATHQQEEMASTSWMNKFNPYHWIKANPVTLKVENLPANLVLPMQKTLVQEYDLTGPDFHVGSVYGSRTGRSAQDKGRSRALPARLLQVLQAMFVGDVRSDDVPLATMRQGQRQSVVGQDPANDGETDRHLEILASVNPEIVSTENMSDVLHERRAQREDFIRNHPSYDKTFWIFSQKNRVRQWCQRIVRPAGGERVFGTPPSDVAHPIFQLVIFLTVTGGIIVEALAPPFDRRNYYIEHGLNRAAWFNVAEAVFGLTLTVEFLVKIIADGFILTPNAYLKSIWNILDLLILVGLVTNVTLTLIFVGGLSRMTRALKALRALRLITLMDKMRSTFQSLILSGAIRILDAAILAILYLIPFSVWGTNIFAGLMNECNDTSVSGLSGCTDEFVNTVYGDSFGFPVPRVWGNPSPSTTFSFDNFPASMLILFEIVSLEGWVDVMSVAMNITGFESQPAANGAAQVNAIFFVTYNLLGGVVILTLFVSIIIGNFSSKTGMAFLTQPQREWIDLQKLIRRQRPSKRPLKPPSTPLRAWCYDRAVHKHGWWSRMMTFLFIAQIIALMTQSYSQSSSSVTSDVSDALDDIFLLVTFAYVIDIAVRFFGLGWRSFRANGWNIFDIVVASGSFVTSLIVRSGTEQELIEQLQKLFLVSIAFKLVQRTNSLNKLFKNAMASLRVIINLLALWLTLFLFFAIIYIEVFGMTKWNTAETHTQNYRSMGSALVMLAFMSTGEGWNQYMHDFTLAYPRCTDTIDVLDETDCGSSAWAFSCFIAWNLLSMYIFVNMFTGVVVENFSYVFQVTGGAKSITREEMRSFKKVWAEFADPRTGLLDRSRFVAFFAKLSGVFEVRIYPPEHSIQNLLAQSDNGQPPSKMWSLTDSEVVDVPKLNRLLSSIDYQSIRKRRNVYTRLYYEASISHHGRGISFTDMLLLLAHHKLIVDRDALILKDLVARNETNKLVTDLVNLDRVRSLLKMISLRRRFLAQQELLRATRDGRQGIPAIIVDSSPATPSLMSKDISSPGHEFSHDYQISPPFPPPQNQDGSPVLSLSESLSPSLLRRARRSSDISMLSADTSHANIWRDSSLGDEPSRILSSMDNSVWGEMMLHAAEEDDSR